jgi:AraC-like DNA-binding protein
MFYLVGIVLSFFLGFLLISKKEKKLADKILSIWIFIMGVHLLLFYLFIAGKIYNYPFLLGPSLPMPLLHGPFLFLYASALTNRLPKNKFTNVLHFLPAVISYIYLIPFFMKSGVEKINVFENKGIGYETYVAINNIVIMLSGIFYVARTTVLLNQHRRSILNEFSSTEKINLIWLRNLVYGIAIIWALVIFSGQDEFIFSAVVFFIMFICYFGIKQVGIFTYKPPAETAIINKYIDSSIASDSINDQTSTSNEQDTNNLSSPQLTIEKTAFKIKYQKSGLNQETADQLHEKLIQLTIKEKIFTEPELTLTELAKLLDTHPNYLSQVINEREKKNFFDYINTLRIQEFIHVVSEPGNEKFTLLAIAFDCGFNSKSSFNKYFKKVTGLSPSEYLQRQNLKQAG